MTDQTTPDQSIRFTYTNWQGKTSERHATPISIRYGSTGWHPYDCWLMLAYDHDKNAEREFSLVDFSAATPPAATPQPVTVAEAAKVLLDTETQRQFLWDLLDDIDTLDDACKEHDASFRKRAYAIQRRRYEISTSDGYTVTFRDTPSRDQELTSPYGYCNPPV